MSGNGGSLTFDLSDFIHGLNITEDQVKTGAKKGMQDSVDDLKRIAVDISPIDESDLRRSAKSKIRSAPTKIIGEVTFNVTTESAGYGRFNYAYWTHEMDYNLGEQSRQAPGTDGYEVGNKYLERPLKGEAEKYVRWIAEEIRDAVGD